MNTVIYNAAIDVISPLLATPSDELRNILAGNHVSIFDRVEEIFEDADKDHVLHLLTDSETYIKKLQILNKEIFQISSNGIQDLSEKATLEGIVSRINRTLDFVKEVADKKEEIKKEEKKSTDSEAEEGKKPEDNKTESNEPLFKKPSSAAKHKDLAAIERLKKYENFSIRAREHGLDKDEIKKICKVAESKFEKLKKNQELTVLVNKKLPRTVRYDDTTKEIRVNVKKIGSGGYKDVFLSIFLKTGIPFASLEPKKTNDPIMLQWSQYDISNEWEKLKKYKGAPHIIQAHQINKQGVLLEFMNLGNVDNVLEKGNIKDNKQMKKIALDLLDGLVEIHKQGYVHNDLKPANFLVSNKNGEYQAKIADFGCEKPINAMAPFIGTLTAASSKKLCAFSYGAPFLSTPSDDIWAMGISLYLMHHRHIPPIVQIAESLGAQNLNPMQKVQIYGSFNANLQLFLQSYKPTNVLETIIFKMLSTSNYTAKQAHDDLQKWEV